MTSRLTKAANHASLPTFVLRASWQSTGKTIKLQAQDEEEAIAKALKRKDLQGMWELKVLEKGDV